MTQLSKTLVSEHGSETKYCKSILIVEDDTGIRETLKIFLEIEGYEVALAANGQEGLEALPKTSDLGLIILDLMMPVMTGWEFAEKIKKTDYSDIPILVVTAYSEKLGDLKHNGLIKKPINLSVLLKIVKQWCGDSLAKSG